ncbi:DUF2207 family protein [Guggenheimella bovis]
MKKKKVYKSKQLERAIYLSRVKWLIPLGFGLLHFVLHFAHYVQVFFKNPSLNTLLSILFASLLWGIFFAGLPFIVVQVYSDQLKHESKMNATFKGIEFLDYYKEKLHGLTPAMISLIADLQIETEKDLSASILELKMRKARTESERYIVDALREGGLQKIDRKKWREIAEREAVDAGYIEKAGKKKQRSIGCLFHGLMVVGVGLYFWLDKPLYNKFEVLSEQTIGDEKLLDVFIQNPDVLIFSLVVLVASYSLAYFFFVPIVAAFAMRGYNEGHSDYQRTALGNEKAELINGMKNYIHDFSDLSTAHQEELILWDDYLIYAVVLEENEQILEDIKKKRREKGMIA